MGFHCFLLIKRKNKVKSQFFFLSAWMTAECNCACLIGFSKNHPTLLIIKAQKSPNKHVEKDKIVMIEWGIAAIIVYLVFFLLRKRSMCVYKEKEGK
jgi:hypothetical protein